MAGAVKAQVGSVPSAAPTARQGQADAPARQTSRPAANASPPAAGVFRPPALEKRSGQTILIVLVSLGLALALGFLALPYAASWLADVPVLGALADRVTPKALAADRDGVMITQFAEQQAALEQALASLRQREAALAQREAALQGLGQEGLGDRPAGALTGGETSATAAAATAGSAAGQTIAQTIAPQGARSGQPAGTDFLTVYQSMSPARAAAILQEMADETVLTVLRGIDRNQGALILAAMDADRAARLLEVLILSPGPEPAG